MEQRIFLAAVAAALMLSAGAAVAQDANEHSDQPSAGYDQPAPARDQAVPSQDADHDRKVKARHRKSREQQRLREEQGQMPNRMAPERAFPGDLPQKTTTPGSLDREGRILQDNRSTPAPPASQQSEDKGEYK